MLILVILSWNADVDIGDDVMEPAVDVCNDVMDLDVGDAVMDPGDDIGGMVMHPDVDDGAAPLDPDLGSGCGFHAPWSLVSMLVQLAWKLIWVVLQLPWFNHSPRVLAKCLYRVVYSSCLQSPLDEGP
jgi:hypothetical protein